MLAQVKKHRSRAQTFTAIAVRVLFTNFVDTDNCYFIPILFFFVLLYLSFFFVFYFFFIAIIIMRLPHHSMRRLMTTTTTTTTTATETATVHGTKKKVIIKPNCAYNGIALENTAHNKIHTRARLRQRNSEQSE